VSATTLHDQLRAAHARLVAAGFSSEDAAIDADVLARHALGWTREQLILGRTAPPPDGFAAHYAALVARRACREPAAYIIGHREFWGLEFEVTRDVLIPRPETELIVEETLALQPALGEEPAIVDVGTGSGCLAVTLARELPRARVVAIDVSIAALEVARRNAVRHGVAGRMTWHAASLLEPLRAPVDLIVSNPPYVPLRDASSLSPDVRDYEPGVALFSGQDGLATIRALLAQAVDRVRPGGWLIFEFGYGQDTDVTRMVEDAGVWTLLNLRRDLQDIPRTAVLQRRA
jgi:release factor glutamine methyltransferase